MAGHESQKLQDKLQETVKLLSAGKGNREDTAAVLTDAAERLNALEVSNRRLREEARGPAQTAWTGFMGDAIKGYLSHEDVLDFTDLQWQSVLDNCEDIADAALLRWKMRWVDGVAPAKKRKPPRGDGGEAKPAEPIATPDEARAFGKKIDDLFGPEPRPERWTPRMADAASPAPKESAVPVAQPTKPMAEPTAPTPPAVAKPAAPAPSGPVTPAPKAAPPPPNRPPPPASVPPLATSKERQPGDD